MCVMGNEYAGFLCFSKRNPLQLKRTIISGNCKVTLILILCYLKGIREARAESKTFYYPMNLLFIAV